MQIIMYNHYESRNRLLYFFYLLTKVASSLLDVQFSNHYQLIAYHVYDVIVATYIVSCNHSIAVSAVVQI